MRHKKKGKTLGRTAAPRKALFRSLVISFVEHGRIKTTISKAKAMRPIVEKLISMSRKNDLATRRLLLSRVHHGATVNKLLTVIGPRYMERPGGYTRIMKVGPRPGDGAEVAIIELV
jgi:large subunit ribosomal protein L17